MKETTKSKIGKGVSAKLFNLFFFPLKLLNNND